MGMGKLESTINTGDLIMKAATIRGSVGGTREEYRRSNKTYIRR